MGSILNCKVMIGSNVIIRLLGGISILLLSAQVVGQVKMDPTPRTVKAKFENMHTKVVQPEAHRVDLRESWRATSSMTGRRGRCTPVDHNGNAGQNDQ